MRPYGSLLQDTELHENVTVELLTRSRSTITVELLACLYGQGYYRVGRKFWYARAPNCEYYTMAQSSNDRRHFVIGSSVRVTNADYEKLFYDHYQSKITKKYYTALSPLKVRS